MSVIVDEVVDFLKAVPPFQFLDEETLKVVSAEASVEFFPKGTTILFQEGPAAENLMVIKKGGVKVFVRSSDEEEVIIDYRSEGDVFGFLSLVSGDKSRANIMTVEDSIVYMVARDKILNLLETNPAFTEYYVKSFLSKFIDKTFSEMHNKSLLYGGGDKLLFTTPVGELATKEVVTASLDLTIREAAEVMSAKNISSLILVENDVPRGIVTDRDLREKVVARGMDIGEPISTIMTVSLIKIEARHLCFEALLKMIHFNIHHLVVVDEGKLKGVVTNHDLMILQGTSPLSLARDIETQQSIETIVPAAKKTNGMIQLLLKEGAKASNVTRVVTEINDRLVRKIITIAERKFGKPPVNYCWLCYGSEGRKEQTFKTDQDNALIYDNPDTPDRAREAEQYFRGFSEFVNDALVQCGFPECPGGYMARNEKWRQPLSVWKEYFSNWIKTPTPEAVLYSVILFDFRPVAGSLALGEILKAHLLHAVQNQGIFLKHMSDLASAIRPPLGFFKTFVVLKSGEHKDQLDLKKSCLTPLINVVRLFALEEGIPETSTLERIAALREKHRIVREFADELEHAFEFFSLLRIHHQFDQVEAGGVPDNFINPDVLSNLQKRTFKESCQIIARIQEQISKQYSPGMRM
jgi:CBS domain-containing protein